MYFCPKRSNLVWANCRDRELRVAGPATQATGCGAGMVGFHSLGVSSLVIKLAIDTRAMRLAASV